MGVKNWNHVGRQMSLFLLYQSARNAHTFAMGQGYLDVAEFFQAAMDMIQAKMQRDIPGPRVA